jgi:hypothetical protein
MIMHTYEVLLSFVSGIVAMKLVESRERGVAAGLPWLEN